MKSDIRHVCHDAFYDHVQRSTIKITVPLSVSVDFGSECRRPAKSIVVGNTIISKPNRGRAEINAGSNFVKFYKSLKITLRTYAKKNQTRYWGLGF